MIDLSEIPTPPPNEKRSRIFFSHLAGWNWKRWLPVSLLLLLVLAGMFLLFRREAIIEEAERPLGPTLPAYPTFTPTAASAQNSDPAATASPGAAALPTPIPITICGGPPEMLILATGADTSEGYLRGNADVIRVIRIDFVTPGMAVLTIPRDLWVTLPGMEAYGPQLLDYFGRPLTPDGIPLDFPENSGRVNVAYFYGILYNLPGGGPGTLAQTLYANFGLPIDHYVAVDMTILPLMIDRLGGIDIYVDVATPEFATGMHRMNGEEALLYARSREADNDWYRNDRQNQVLLAMRERFLRPGTLADLPLLIDIFADDVLTDLSKAQISILGCAASQIDREAIHSYTIEYGMVTETYTEKGAFVLLPKHDQVREVIEAFLHDDLSPGSVQNPQY